MTKHDQILTRWTTDARAILSNPASTESLKALAQRFLGMVDVLQIADYALQQYLADPPPMGPDQKQVALAS